MATLEQINTAVREAAEANFRATRISRVLAEPTITSTGEDAVRVVIVFPDRVAGRVSGDELLHVLADVRRRLDDLAEGRLPILEYATEDELASNDDPES